MNTAAIGLAGGLLFGLSLGVARADGLPTIDNFASGPVTITFNGARQSGDLVTTKAEQGAHILGGSRVTSFELPLLGNPFLLNAEFQIKGKTATAPPALTISTGFQMSARLDMSYGNYVNQPLGVDLSGYDRFRIHFLALDGDQNIIVQTFPNTTPSGEGEWGCSLASSPYHPVVVDMPFGNSPGAMLDNISQISLIIQGGAYGYDTGIALFEVVKRGAPAGDVTCPPIGG